MSRNRLVIVASGCDWSDASYEDLLIPEDMDLAEEKKMWGVWYRDEYMPRLNAGEKPKYVSFTDFLREKGARNAGTEQFFDD